MIPRFLFMLCWYIICALAVVMFWSPALFDWWAR